MNLFVLSELVAQQNHVGLTVGYTFQEALASCCDVTFIYPESNTKINLFDGCELSIPESNFLNRRRHRIFKSWYKIKEKLVLGRGPNILLVIGLTPRFLLSMHGLGSLVEQFDLRIGYLLDGFSTTEFDRTVIPLLDHLFVITSEMAGEITNHLGISSSFLPLATDVLGLGSNRASRFIDIVGCGRIDPVVHQHLVTHYSQPKAHRVYFHSTFKEPYVHNLAEHTLLLSKLLSCSRISLCFEPSYVPRFQGYSPMVYRWFEGWASGCTIVGRKPWGKGTAQLMDWENSTYELPDDPNNWIPFFEQLLDDKTTLLKNSQRNYRESLLRHDWRYRIRDIFHTLELPIPEKLHQEIARLTEKAETEATRFVVSKRQLESDLLRQSFSRPLEGSQDGQFRNSTNQFFPSLKSESPFQS
jgi:hypothetical protein